ncbi:MAG: hypothetical protein K6G15_10795 [Desulfovibrio sp.]|nr:hypothetical protein [Desulfovibrio sp.]
MSQIRLNNEPSKGNLNVGEPQLAVSHPNRELPPELANARPSTSGWAKIGRVAAYIARGIGAVATLGISEGIIWGIRKLYKYCHASPMPPQARLPKKHPPMLPQAEPSVDADNSALKNGLLKLNIPQKHLDALNSLLDDMRLRYGDVVPKNLAELRTFKTTTEPFIVLLRRSVSDSDEYVDPARLQRMAKEILEPELIRHAVETLLQEKAQSLGLQLRPEGFRLATEILFQSLKKVNESMPLGTEKASIESFLNNEGMGNTLMVKDSFQRIEKFVNAEDVLQRAALLDGLNTSNLPPAYQQAINTICKNLRDAYGQDCLPMEMSELLRTHLGTGVMLLDKLRTMVKNITGDITPKTIADTVTSELARICQRHAMSQALGELMEKNHGLKLHPKILPNLLERFAERCPAVTEAMAGVSNTQTARQALTDLEAQVAPFLAEVAANITAVEEHSLSNLSPEIRPLLQNIIRSLPFDNASKEQSQAMVDRLLLDMPTWKASIPMGDKSLDAFCAKLADELNIRMATLRGEDKRFIGDIYGTFQDDANRNKWILNGKVMNHRPTNEVIGQLEQIAPHPLDRQFLSKLANQYLWSALVEPLKGVMLPKANNPQQMEVRRVWQYSGDDVEGPQRNNGLSFNTPTEFEFFVQPKDVDMPDDGQFSISVSEDGKSAVVEVVMDTAMITGNMAKIPVGSARHVMQVHCDLSAGTNVRPRVTKVVLSQELTPLIL